MTNSQAENPRTNFDLEKRTTEFGKGVIRLCRSVKQDSVNRRIIDQLVGSAGSVGANYREANDALGKKDFLHRMKISRKECKEVLHWLEMFREANPGHQEEEVRVLWREGEELKKILSAIIVKST